MGLSVYTDSPYAFTEGKVLLADRAYMAAENTAIPTARQDGATPGGYTDLGSLLDSKVAIEKDDSDIINYETGLFRALRDQVARKDGDARARFTVVEYEPAVWAAFTGSTTFAVGTGTGIYVGGQPIIKKALFIAGQNPNTTTEFHHYSPSANLVWKQVENDDFKGIEITANFLKYAPIDDPNTLTGRDFLLVTHVAP